MKCFLIDPWGTYYKIILKKNIYISLLIVISDEIKNEILSLNLDNIESDNIFSINDIYQLDTFKSFDINKIKEFNFIKFKNFYWTSRHMDSLPNISDSYYTALSWFVNFFDNTDIDLILHTQIPHGFIYDSLPLEIAKMKSIPIFVMCDVSSYKYPLKSVYFLNKKTPLKLSLIIEKNYLIENSFENNYLKDLKSYSKLNKLFKNFIINFFIFKKSTYKFKIIYIKKFFKIIFISIFGKVNFEIFFSIFNFKLKRDFNTGPKNHTLFINHHSIFRLIYGYLYSIFLKIYYYFISVNPDLNSKFIYFSLSFEPEAANADYKILSQISLIKMISSNIPKNILLYVKEHPHQFDLNNDNTSYQLYSIQKFRNSKFYKSIKDLKNVKLIKSKISSKELISNSIFVASMSGSVNLESFICKKKCIIFDTDLNIYSKLPNVYLVDNKEKFEKFIDQDLNHEKINYDLSNVLNYLFNNTDEQINLVIDKIIEYAKKTWKKN